MGFIACPTQSVADVMTERLGAFPGAVLDELPGAMELLVQRVVAHALRAGL